jgi:hypothetical protein
MTGEFLIEVDQKQCMAKGLKASSSATKLERRATVL